MDTKAQNITIFVKSVAIRPTTLQHLSHNQQIKNSYVMGGKN
jgi:cold shock CspA family protein